jgi:hypothetical protein
MGGRRRAGVCTFLKSLTEKYVVIPDVCEADERESRRQRFSLSPLDSASLGGNDTVRC